jgi:hypothetical protein
VARTARDQRNSRPPRGPGVRIGCVGDAGFVPHVHNFDARTSDLSQSFIQMVSHERKNPIDTELNQSTRKQFST